MLQSSIHWHFQAWAWSTGCCRFVSALPLAVLQNPLAANLFLLRVIELQLSRALDSAEEKLDYTKNRKVVLLGQKTVRCKSITSRNERLMSLTRCTVDVRDIRADR
jgi:hypothetical protein